MWKEAVRLPLINHRASATRYRRPQPDGHGLCRLDHLQPSHVSKMTLVESRPKVTTMISHASASYLLTATVSLTPISGTVLPTTAAIWRTCFINSSN